MDAAHAQASELIAQQRYGDAVPLLVRACASPEASARCWIDLGLCLIALDMAAEFLQLVERRHARAGDGVRLFFDCLHSALAWPDRGPVGRIIALTPRDSVLSIVALYLSGIISCARDPDQGIAEIKAALKTGRDFAAHFDKDPFLATILYEGDVLEGFDEVADLESTDRRVLLERVRSVQKKIEFAMPPGAPGDERFVFLSSCDERYLDRFGMTVANALDRTACRTVFHLHVVDPSAELDAKIARIRESCVNLDVRYSTERYRSDHSGYSRASYYACSRLVRLPEILAHYGRDIFIWDVDLERVRDMRRLIEAAQGHDLAYFEVKNQRPSLVCHLASVYVANTEAARRCASLVGKYVLAKLASAPFWLLDQSSVFCVSRYLRSKGLLRINDFSAHPGGAFETYVEVAASAAEKQSMRGRANPALLLPETVAAAD